MSVTRYCPRFQYGTGPTTFDLMWPTRIWVPRIVAVGGGARSAVGVGAAYEVRRDYLLDVTLRIDETEHGAWAAFMAFAQAWPNSFEFFPDQDDALISYTVDLDRPIMGEEITFTLDQDEPGVAETTITLRKFDGTPWTLEWFAES